MKKREEHFDFRVRHDGRYDLVSESGRGAKELLKDARKQGRHKFYLQGARTAGQYSVRSSWNVLRKQLDDAQGDNTYVSHDTGDTVWQETNVLRQRDRIRRISRQLKWNYEHFIPYGRYKRLVSEAQNSLKKEEIKLLRQQRKIDKIDTVIDKEINARVDHPPKIARKFDLRATLKRSDTRDKHIKRLVDKQKKRMMKVSGLQNKLRYYNKKIVLHKVNLAAVTQPVFKFTGIAACFLLAFIFFIMPIANFFAMAAGGSSRPAPIPSDLFTVEQAMVTSLRGSGMQDIQIAAIIGNGYAESGNDPHSYAILDGITSYAYERAGGLFQWTDCGDSATHLINHGLQDMTAYVAQKYQINWQMVADDTTCTSYEMDYFYQGYNGGEFQNRKSWYKKDCPQYSTLDTTKETFEASTDVSEATYIFMAGYEGPADGYTHFDVRSQHAQDVYAALQGGGYDPDGDMTDIQKKIVDAAKSEPYVGDGYCATWTSKVYQDAGFGSITGNACDQYWTWCTSFDRNDLKPGMLIAVPKWNGGARSLKYGHVGIYIGNGKVRHNAAGPTVSECTVDEWISQYGGMATPKWGFANGVTS